MNSRTSTRIASASGGSSTGSKRNIGVAIVVSLPVRVEAGEGVRNALNVGHQVFCQSGWSARREMQVNGIGNAAEALVDSLCQRVVGATGCKDANCIVGYLRAHALPLTLHRHAMQFGTEVFQSVQRQNWKISSGGTVESYTPTRLFH